MGFGASKYFMFSGEFGDWGFWLFASISAVDESAVGLVMRYSIVVCRICSYPQSTLSEKESKMGTKGRKNVKKPKKTKK